MTVTRVLTFAFALLWPAIALACGWKQVPIPNGPGDYLITAHLFACAAGLVVLMGKRPVGNTLPAAVIFASVITSAGWGIFSGTGPWTFGVLWTFPLLLIPFFAMKAEVKTNALQLLALVAVIAATISYLQLNRSDSVPAFQEVDPAVIKQVNF